MSHHHHQIHLLKKAYEELSHSDGDLKGAAAGAVAVAGTAATALALAGLALTPVGWVVLGGAGALAGRTGLFKKLKGRFS